MTKIKIYRGIGANSLEQLDEYINEFMAGGMAGTHGSRSDYGEGDYFTASKKVAKAYADHEDLEGNPRNKFTHIFEFEIDRDKFYSRTDLAKATKAAFPGDVYVNYTLKQNGADWLAERYEKFAKFYDDFKSKHLGEYVPDSTAGKLFLIKDREKFLRHVSDLSAQIEVKEQKIELEDEYEM